MHFEWSLYSRIGAYGHVFFFTFMWVDFCSYHWRERGKFNEGHCTLYLTHQKLLTLLHFVKGMV